MADDEQRIRAQQEMAAAAFHEDTAKIVEMGRSNYGVAAFDEAAQALVGHLGNRADELMAIAQQYDDPCGILMDLAADEARLKKFASLPTARMVVELGRIEARSKPHGYVTTGTQPAWRERAKNGERVTADDWARGYGDNLSDKAWNREFDRHQRARMERKFR